jgi:hypothetical protein
MSFQQLRTTSSVTADARGQIYLAGFVNSNFGNSGKLGSDGVGFRTSGQISDGSPRVLRVTVSGASWAPVWTEVLYMSRKVVFLRGGLFSAE